MSANRIQAAFVSIAMFSLLIATSGCDTASDSIPTTKSSGTSKGTSGGQAMGAPQQGAPGAEGMGMAGMADMAGMMGDGPSIGGGGPDSDDMTSEYAAQALVEAPDSGPGTTDSELLGGGGFGAPQDPAFAPIPGVSSEQGAGVDSYLESGGGNLAAGSKPASYDSFGNYIGDGGVIPKAGVNAKRPQTPAQRPRQDVLRNKNNVGGQLAAASALAGGSRGGSGTGQGAILSITNPVMNYDGTGFAIGFGADYQLLRAPEPNTQYVWVVSFTELSKTGAGSRPRLVQTPIKLRDSGSVRAVVPLQGQPKGPYKCMIAAKKGGRTQQITKWVNFPVRAN